MIDNDLINKIADKNVDVEHFSQLIISNAELRDLIVNLMMNNPKIMVYYHSYYIVEKSCKMNPELFYNYWDSFASLIKHENSYHRDFGLTLIANLTEVETRQIYAHFQRLF